MANRNQFVLTPITFISAVERYFNITFKYDMAANILNRRCELYFDESFDSLKNPWPTDGYCWLNPPFKNLTKWVEKCNYECHSNGCRIISIWPLSGDYNQVLTWTRSQVNIIHGRIWPEVRSCMLCHWFPYQPCTKPIISGLVWDKVKLTRKW